MERNNLDAREFFLFSPGWRGLRFPAFLSVSLVLVSFSNFLLFHTLTELFAIMVCGVMFAVAWHTHEFSRNYFLMYLGSGYLWVGGMDLLHALLYKGAGIFMISDANPSVQFWIATRYLESFLLISAPLFLTRSFSRKQLFFIFGIIATFSSAAIFYGYFPLMFIEGTGLTPFKVYSEYIIITVLMGAIAHLLYKRELLERSILILMVTSVVLTIASEFSFTLFVSVFGLPNMVGHIFKLLSFWFIFQAIVATNLKKPYRDLIDTRKKAEEGEKEAEHQKNIFESIFNGITDAIVLTDIKREVVAVNPGMKEIFGYELADLAGETTSKLYESEEEYESQGKIRFNLSEKEKLEPYIVKYQRKDGSIFTGETLGRAIRDSDGNTKGFLGVIRDITSRQDKAKEIRKLSHAIEQSPASIIITDIEGNIEYINPRCEQLTGYTMDEVLGKNPRIFKSGHTSPDEYKKLWDTISAGGEWHGEICNKKKNGDIFWERASISAIKSADGNIINFVGIKEDVTEQRQAQKLSSRFGRIVDESLNEIYVFDANTLKFIQVNRGAIENLGYSIDELQGMTPIDIKPRYSLQEFNKLLAPLQDGTKKRVNFETTHQRKNGTVYEANIHLQLFKSETPPVYAAIVEDITKRKSAERALRESEELKSAILDGAHVGVVTIDHDGTVVEFNKAAGDMFRYSRSEALGKNVENLIIPAEYRKKHLNGFKRYLNTGKSNIVDKPIKITAMRAGGEEFPCQLLITHQEGLGLFTAFIDDLTGEKEIEETLHRTQKMEAIGQMVGGIAHDFNNILGIVMGNLEIIDRMTGDEEKLRGRIETAMKGAKRGADLTRRLLGFSQQAPARFEPTNIGDVLDGMQNLLDRSLTQAIDVEYTFEKNLWLTEIDSADFEDAIINLALNARDAMPNGGSLKIGAENIHCSELMKCPPHLIGGDYIRLTISDNGVGMSSEVKGKAFEPFFSTKEKGMGTGLGLSMVYGFVQRSGGYISINSEPGKGTAFVMSLPRTTHVMEGKESNSLNNHVLPHGNEILLIVDDEEELVNLAVYRLEGAGYRVFRASNAADAMAIMDSGEHIDLLVSDIIMPGGMNGYELAETVLENYPEIKILLTTGYVEPDQLRKNINLPEIKRLNEELLRKPYTGIALLEKIRQILDE